MSIKNLDTLSKRYISSVKGLILEHYKNGLYMDKQLLIDLLNNPEQQFFKDARKVPQRELWHYRVGMNLSATIHNLNEGYIKSIADNLGCLRRELHGLHNIADLVELIEDSKNCCLSNELLKSLQVEINVINALEILLKNDILIQQLGEHGQVDISGKIYQRVGATTPSEQLWGLGGQIVVKRIRKQSQEWKDTYIKKVKGGNGNNIYIVEINALKTLLTDYIEEQEELHKSYGELKNLGESGQLDIGGKIYQRVGTTTPSEQLWGLKLQIVVKRIRKQSQEWKDGYIKKAKLNQQPVDVVEINALEILLKNDILIQQLGEHGQVDISGKIYQQVGATTPSEQLWGLGGQIVVKRVKGQSQEWKDIYVKKVKGGNGNNIYIVEINALRTLFANDIKRRQEWEGYWQTI